MASVFRFPETVDDVSARLVAAGVVLLTLLILVPRWTVLIPVLAYGFLARVLTGPTLSPLGQLATRAVRPLVPAEPRITAGAPKRFAQAIGATLSISAAVLHVGFGLTGAAFALIAMITVAATLEAALGFCLGCWIFARLMDAGVIPAEVCEACNDIRLRHEPVA